MANEYQQAFESFELSFEPMDTSHSGVSSFADTLQDWLDQDETEAEEAFANYLDSESLELLVTLEDCLNGIDLGFVLEEQAHDSFVNGQFEQFKSQYRNLCPVDFQTYMEQNIDDKEQLKILKWLLINL